MSVRFDCVVCVLQVFFQSVSYFVKSFECLYLTTYFEMFQFVICRSTTKVTDVIGDMIVVVKGVLRQSFNY